MSPAAAETGFVTRFAPSPTGLLHRGHAFSALTAFRAAGEAGGQFILRIEDIDASRCREEYTAAIFEDLAWLGLDWNRPVWRQSERLSVYAQALDELRARGLIYRCFKSRSELVEDIGRAPHAPQRAYFGRALPPEDEARRLAEGRPFAWRLSIAAAEHALGGFSHLTFCDHARGVIAADPWAAGDVILGRKDAGVAYHLAAVLDDAAQGVTCVIRGEDLLEACHVQRLLQALLALPTPKYRHHRLISGPDGRRLAKRDASQTLRALREAGVTVADLAAEMGL